MAHDAGARLEVGLTNPWHACCQRLLRTGLLAASINLRFGSTTRLPPRRNGFDSQRGSSRIFAFGNRDDDAAGRRVFSGTFRFPPPLHSGAAPYSPRFTLIGSQDLDVTSLTKYPPPPTTPLSSSVTHLRLWLSGLSDLSRTQAVIGEISYEIANHRNPFHRPVNGNNAADIGQCRPWAAVGAERTLARCPREVGEHQSKRPSALNTDEHTTPASKNNKHDIYDEAGSEDDNEDSINDVYDDSHGSEDDDDSLDVPTHFTNELPSTSDVTEVEDVENISYRFTEDPTGLADNLKMNSRGESLRIIHIKFTRQKGTKQNQTQYRSTHHSLELAILAGLQATMSANTTLTSPVVSQGVGWTGEEEERVALFVTAVACDVRAVVVLQQLLEGSPGFVGDPLQAQAVAGTQQASHIIVSRLVEQKAHLHVCQRIERRAVEDGDLRAVAVIRLQAYSLAFYCIYSQCRKWRIVTSRLLRGVETETKMYRPFCITANSLVSSPHGSRIFKRSTSHSLVCVRTPQNITLHISVSPHQSFAIILAMPHAIHGVAATKRAELAALPNLCEFTKTAVQMMLCGILHEEEYENLLFLKDSRSIVLRGFRIFIFVLANVLCNPWSQFLGNHAHSHAMWMVKGDGDVGTKEAGHAPTRDRCGIGSQEMMLQENMLLGGIDEQMQVLYSAASGRLGGCILLGPGMLRADRRFVPHLGQLHSTVRCMGGSRRLGRSDNLVHGEGKLHLWYHVQHGAGRCCWTVHLNLRWFVDDWKMREMPILHATTITGLCIGVHVSIFCDETVFNATIMGLGACKFSYDRTLPF
ncbi:hypothetical protein PR048_028925 [Dryococelus australis]|uniref:Uncharacterized protein n=1 Tax=Dryococelus australis TaxID=614101 RepID=A0ABQ9GBZ6_9NEOP|nr:hypothetical protein PR048_028925 [Dryococelus australis]